VSVKTLRRRLHGTGPERGFSLPELLVTMLIGSVVLLAVATTFVGTLKGSRGATSRISNTSEIRLAMDVMERRLRVAVRSPAGSVFTVAKPKKVSFWASLAPGVDTADVQPSLVTYEVLSGCLQESIAPPTGSTRTTCLARGQVNTSTDLFAFYPEAAAPVPVSATATAPPPAAALAFDALGKLADADLDRVLSVGLTLTVRDPANSSLTTATRSQSRVTLTNRVNENTSGRIK
jgi:prepilin-type N-terminal cleavage/methylation domain-containing protein